MHGHTTSLNEEALRAWATRVSDDTSFTARTSSLTSLTSCAGRTPNERAIEDEIRTGGRSDEGTGHANELGDEAARSIAAHELHHETHRPTQPNDRAKTTKADLLHCLKFGALSVQIGHDLCHTTQNKERSVHAWACNEARTLQSLLRSGQRVNSHTRNSHDCSTTERHDSNWRQAKQRKRIGSRCCQSPVAGSGPSCRPGNQRTGSTPRKSASSTSHDQSPGIYSHVGELSR